jgi:hypothetical protein
LLQPAFVEPDPRSVTGEPMPTDKTPEEQVTEVDETQLDETQLEAAVGGLTTTSPLIVPCVKTIIPCVKVIRTT